MSRRRILLAVFLACLTSSIPAITQRPAAASGKPSSGIQVTSIIADYVDVNSSSGSQEQIFMQVRSDAAGPYTNDIGSDWVLDTAPSGRHVFLDFSKPIPGTGPNGGAPVAPFTAALVSARLLTRCDLYGESILNIPAGSTLNCPLAIFFNSGNYLLQMDPGPLGTYVFPETDVANITCNGVANSECNNWTISPNGARGGCATPDCSGSLMQNVARLSKIVTVRGQNTAVNQGDFYVAFSIGVTNP